MLETCSSQAGASQWSKYSDYIGQKVAQSYHGFRHHSGWTTLTPKLLLACMDYLYILQRLPNDRILVINLQLGFITVIIWAHYCLDLRVVISGVPGGDIFFGNSSEGSAQVVIKWSEDTMYQVSHDSEACLYDKDMHLVLETPAPGHTRIEACERLPLEDYGTTVIWRWLNQTTTTEKNATVVTDSVQYVLAMAIVMLPNLVRFPWDVGPEPVSSLQIQRWQIYNAAKVMFASTSYSETAFESYVKRMQGRDPLGTIEPPPSLMRHWEGIRRPRGRPVPMHSYMIRLSALIVVLASVSGTELCGQIPLIADPTYIGVKGFIVDAERKPGSHVVKSTDLYHTLVQALVGGYDTFVAEETATAQTTFMVSEYGWTIFLSSVGAKDPSLATPEQLFLRKGVPTKATTKERRFRVRDANNWAPQVKRARLNSYNDVLNRGKTHVPRCAEHVIERAELYGTTKLDFRLNIRHIIEVYNSPDDRMRKFEVYSSYRAFHEGLWNSILAPPCLDGGQDEDQGDIQLPLGVSASIGMDEDDARSDDSGESGKTCVALVKDDPNSRWLAVVGSERNVMIRGVSTCVSCAIESAASLPEKWTVVI